MHCMHYAEARKRLGEETNTNNTNGTNNNSSDFGINKLEETD